MKYVVIEAASNGLVVARCLREGCDWSISRDQFGGRHGGETFFGNELVAEITTHSKSHEPTPRLETPGWRKLVTRATRYRAVRYTIVVVMFPFLAPPDLFEHLLCFTTGPRLRLALDWARNGAQ